MKRYFITATGTDIGKTFTTGLLARQFRAQGKRVSALKPVISGYVEGDDSSDTAQLLAACNVPNTQANSDAISPWRFAAPLSPDMAAAREGRELALGELVEFCRQPADADILLCEGVGGVMVPLNRTGDTVLDWMAALKWPTILVAGSYVGTLSHTLTALEAMRARGIVPAAIIISESQGSAASLDETAQSLRMFLAPATQLLLLPRLELGEKMWHNAPDLTATL